MHRLDSEIGNLHLLKHPFYQRWMEGTLTRDELSRYATYYYPHVLAFPQYVSAVHAQADTPELRKELLENLIEEERGEENHPELWLRFAESLGVDRENIRTAGALPEVEKLVATFRRLTKKSLPSGLGALYAYESQIPDVARQKIEGLKRNYGLNDERGLKFFEVHVEADVYHSGTSRGAFDRLSLFDQQEALSAARIAAQALWDFLSALDRISGIPPSACAH